MFTFVFSCFYHRPIATCFIVDHNLLRLIVVSSTVSFFMSFLISSSDGKIRSDKVIISNHFCEYAADLKS